MPKLLPKNQKEVKRVAVAKRYQCCYLQFSISSEIL